jgi:uncharacterized protein YaiI (UPF0178 family)
MLTIYIDADACPVKEEVYRVAARYDMSVKVVAKYAQYVPANDRTEMIVKPDFGAVDDWIAEQAGPGDIVITADIPLAARCLVKDTVVLDPRGHAFTDNDIGSALAMRQLTEELRQSGVITGGPRAINAKDRSRFLAKLDDSVNAVRRAYPPSS